MDRVNYGWNCLYWLYTFVSFTIKSKEPGTTERVCNLKFRIFPKGPLANSYLSVEQLNGDWENNKNCKAQIDIDPSAINQSCGLFWCSNPVSKDYATVKITILPDPAMFAVIRPKPQPECLLDNSVSYGPIYYFTPNKEANSPIAYPPVCKDGTLTIKLPNYFTYEKLKLKFNKPYDGNSSYATYRITESVGIAGWPANIQNANQCQFDLESRSCEVIIKNASTGTINTGENTSITIKNQGTDKLWPVFDAWSKTSPRKK